ncbi:MAG: L-rhamnose mutarotase [Sphaerochaeta sp.]|jgi:L-rhamnose mutarotase|uniref:L-rhamnose mutarotase n=1 Tax=Sphaerochaeta TaxID=399320 RepID=UPI00182C872B|nr:MULTISPECIES: L-rhamnose mutarotase [Sphaerochaeta]MDT3359642.1 L-rhamnose mutarotase [Spirochaetota bacterium]NCC14577.1 L-rhamnose mutarotase [Spirochaetia bacterium]NLA98426.1 L-rhamnose mutarotase [Spirochaetales bacterium]MDD2395482.1 L-rhamnose mutarotase [Sphaerochaeta sp.]MDD3423161.1 L-rhamnose mutarotase [Sphaerochaeta sp.]
MRKAFVMQLKKGCEAEYQKRHNEIWPELKALLSESGVFDYTIFLERETGKLFAFQQVKGQAGSQGLGGNPIVQKWWAYMADLMETHPDHSPVSTPLEEVFHMD